MRFTRDGAPGARSRLVEPDDDGHTVIVVTGDLGPVQEAAASAPVRNCPERALSLTP
jgi:ferredoxin